MRQLLPGLQFTPVVPFLSRIKSMRIYNSYTALPNI